MKATERIRRHGFKLRMAEPKGFIRRMNQLNMPMSVSRRSPDSVRRPKKEFRVIKTLVMTINGDPLGHRFLLETPLEGNAWIQTQALRVIRRVDNVVLQMSGPIDQAHERMIRGGKVVNSKNLSLYEENVPVIVRGKASAEIKFENSLFLVEQKHALVVDWNLHKEIAPNDSKQVRDCVDPINGAYGDDTVKAVVGVRQFDSAANRRWLKEQGGCNPVCPRFPEGLFNKSKSAKFQKPQLRRSRTVSRIAILINGFLGDRVIRRGISNRELRFAWSVVAQSAWTLARLDSAEVFSRPPALTA